MRVVNVAQGIGGTVDWSVLASGNATLVLLAATGVLGDVAKALDCLCVP